MRPPARRLSWSSATLGERRFAALEILDRWLDPEHRYFKVKVDDGRMFVLLAALVGDR